MKIALFGATGGTGKNVLKRALAAGHEVIVFARKPDTVAVTHERLRVERGDVLDSASFSGKLAGVDAVISTVGPPSNFTPGTLISQGANNLVTGCMSAGVKRFVHESGIIASDGAELSGGSRFALSLLRMLVGKLYQEKIAAEATIRASALEWVIVRPPVLDHSAATGSYQAGVGARISPIKALSHDDVAEFLVKAATEPQWARQIVNVGH